MFIIAEENKSNTLQVKKIYFLSNAPQCGRPHNKNYTVPGKICKPAKVGGCWKEVAEQGLAPIGRVAEPNRRRRVGARAEPWKAGKN